MKKIASVSDKQTRDFARKFAQSIKGGTVISLEGDLGAGKTTFTQGFAEGLGIKERIQSPTFVILKVYRVKGRGARIKRLVHVDAYRLTVKDFKAIGWATYIKDPHNIIVVEWGDKIKSILPKNAMRIIFKHGKKENERILYLPQSLLIKEGK